MLHFWGKYIWRICIHLSLVIREYFLSAVNVLRKGAKNFHVSKSDFYNSITFTMIIKEQKSALIRIESVFHPVFHVASHKPTLKVIL